MVPSAAEPFKGSRQQMACRCTASLSHRQLSGSVFPGLCELTKVTDQLKDDVQTLVGSVRQNLSGGPTLTPHRSMRLVLFVCSEPMLKGLTRTSQTRRGRCKAQVTTHSSAARNVTVSALCQRVSMLAAEREADEARQERR